MFTCIFCSLAIFQKQLYTEFIQKYVFILFLSIAGTIILTYAIVCYKSVARKFPLNYFLLALFTLFESVLVATICTQYKNSIVLAALGLTSLMLITLTLYAWFTPTDFTTCGAFFFVLMIMSVGLGITLIWVKNDLLHLIYCWLGIVAASLYIIYDTQLIVGDKTYALEIDDYVLGAFILYTDIIYLFLKILELLGRN